MLDVSVEEFKHCSFVFEVECNDGRCRNSIPFGDLKKEVKKIQAAPAFLKDIIFDMIQFHALFGCISRTKIYTTAMYHSTTHKLIESSKYASNMQIQMYKQMYKQICKGR